MVVQRMKGKSSRWLSSSYMFSRLIARCSTVTDFSTGRFSSVSTAAFTPR